MQNKRDELELFMGAMLGEGQSSTIERQEKRGQTELTNASRLPCKYNGNLHEQGTYIERLREMGIETVQDYNEQYSKGDLFFDVKLPDGWNIKPSEHHMWSYLTDNKNNERASIFYKAAFYDRDAFLRFND
ncbi:hypothetical protein MKY95_19360 [Paenibacillus sp. FSL P4-0176]|uniref:hypothetical protein n=1 Tax=Paenibacillus sp. FSL P4-0176 TaxID=2921631 RepID=UPI0030D1FB82